MQTFAKGWTSDSGTTLFTQGWVFFENKVLRGRKRKNRLLTKVLLEDEELLLLLTGVIR